jgi:phosphate transport system permease protein
MSAKSIKCKRGGFLGLGSDQVIKYFFGGNAFTAIVVLALITIFLFREGADFFPQNWRNLQIYRKAGLEYVDYIRGVVDDHTALSRYLQNVRERQFKELQKTKSLDETNAALADFDKFSSAFDSTIDDLRSLLSDLTDATTAIKEKVKVNGDRITERASLLKVGKQAEAAKVAVEKIDLKKEILPIQAAFPVYKEKIAQLEKALGGLTAKLPTLPTVELQPRMQKFKILTQQFVAGFPGVEKKLKSWSPEKPVQWYRAVSTFFGADWITNSFWQDCYGLVPLLVGSIMVSLIAMAIAVPLGVFSAIYVSEIAAAKEKNFIKPCIEFISAIPSVVLGFFGIAVLGESLRQLSGFPLLKWVPGFPMTERLNAFTAGCLLALMAIPTIFTLAEDALNNVPRAFKEASYAMGANRIQTIVRILIPASLSGIISAVLLGFGRVIGETMVVLLCAGNRIAIPDFTEGLGVAFQPVHTMTGIIAQEMGEVVRGSIHYRALFMIGIMLFLIALLINFLAQKIVQKFRISIG